MQSNPQSSKPYPGSSCHDITAQSYLAFSTILSPIWPGVSQNNWQPWPRLAYRCKFEIYMFGRSSVRLKVGLVVLSRLPSMEILLLLLYDSVW